MKKFSLISNENIRKHLANTSPAKITHSFSKSKRFLEVNPEYCYIYLDASKFVMKVHLLFQKDIVELGLEEGQILLRTLLMLQHHQHIKFLRNFRSLLAKLTALELEERNPQKEIISIILKRLECPALEQY